jgi:hypothetical protein
LPGHFSEQQPYFLVKSKHHMTQRDVSKRSSMFPAVDKSNIPARPSLRIALLAIIGYA